MPAPRDTFVNPLLTNIYLGYGGEQNFICDDFFPTVYVDKETGLYFVRDKENLRAPTDARRADFARANRVQNSLTTASYALEEKSLEHGIPERVMKNAQSPFDAKKNGTMLVSEKLKLDKEIDLKATILAAGAPGLDTSASWATVSTDVVAQIRTGRNNIQINTGKKANVVVLSKDSYDALMKNTAFIAAVQYTSFPSESALRNKIAEFFDVERVLVADAINNTAKSGQSDVLSYIWSDMAVVAYVNPNPAIESTSAGYELKQTDMAYVDEWYEQQIKTTFVRASDFYDNKVVDPYCMYVLTNTV